MSKVYNIAIDWLWVKGNEFSRREDQGNLRLFIMKKTKKEILQLQVMFKQKPDKIALSEDLTTGEEENII